VCTFALLMIFFFVITMQTARFCQTATIHCLIGELFSPFEGVRM